MSREKAEVCIIVDAYSTGKYIAPTLLGYGYKCIHIQSKESLPDNITKSLRKDDFIKRIIYTDDINYILEQVKNYRIRLCVPGYESGVELADLLCQHLNLEGNSVELSHARRNKWDMVNVVSSSGLLTAKHFKSNNLERIYEWIEKNNINYPVVLKPTLSANGDGVHFCDSKESIKKAFENLLENKNYFSQKNEEVLVETYLDGEEYIVNTVNTKDICYTVEIWRIKRKPFSTIYDRGEIVQPSEKEYLELSKFTEKALRALGILNGAASTELKYTKNGIALIETGARLMGGMELSFSAKMFGFNQLTLMLESYFNPNNFKRIASEVNSNARNRYGWAVVLISNVNGVVKHSSPDEYFKELLSLYSMELPTEGDRLVITTNSLTGPGMIHLMSEDNEQLQKDYEKIRDIEKTLYENMILEKQNVYSSTQGVKKFFELPSSSNQNIVDEGKLVNWVNQEKQIPLLQGCII